VDFGQKEEGVKMGRWLKDFLSNIIGQEASHLLVGNRSPSVLTRVCLLDERKRAFFLEAGDDDKSSGIDPNRKPSSGK
jgi:hypothetical protein